MAKQPDISEAFGYSLRHYRRLKEMSQEELADKANLDRTYISMLERAIKSPSLRSMDTIAQQLGIPLSEIIAHAEARLKRTKRSPRKR